MPLFLNIAPGEIKTGPGIRVVIREDGEAAWLHGKWLDLGEDHGVAWIDGKAIFVRPDGQTRMIGSFPAWVVRSSGPRGPLGIMFEVSQFRGGELRIAHGRRVERFAIT